MVIAVGFGAAAISWSLIVSSIAWQFGPDVAVRFLERGRSIPSTNENLSRGSLQRWMLSSVAHAVQAKGYAYFVMPADILYVLFLAGFLLSASISLQQIIPPLSGWIYIILICVFPVWYAIADLVEDFLIIYVLSRPKRVRQALFLVMRGSTVVKIAAASVSLIQVALLAGWAIWSHPYLSECSYAGLLPHCELEVEFPKFFVPLGLFWTYPELILVTIVLLVIFCGLAAFFAQLAWRLRGSIEQKRIRLSKRIFP